MIRTLLLIKSLVSNQVVTKVFCQIILLYYHHNEIYYVIFMIVCVIRKMLTLLICEDNYELGEPSSYRFVSVKAWFSLTVNKMMKVCMIKAAKIV